MRRRTGLAAATAVAVIAATVVLWSGGADSVAVRRLATHPPASCTGSHRVACGRLIIGSRYVGGMPTEGALVSLTLTQGPTRRALRRMPGGVGHRSVRLPTGRFTLHGVLHICDANCGHLDPPVRCTPAPVRILARRITRATVVLDVARCHVTVSG